MLERVDAKLAELAALRGRIVDAQSACDGGHCRFRTTRTGPNWSPGASCRLLGVQYFAIVIRHGEMALLDPPAIVCRSWHPREDHDLEDDGSDDETLVSATSTQRPLLGREEALRRRHVRNGWIFVAFGVLVPLVALWGRSTAGASVRPRRGQAGRFWWRASPSSPSAWCCGSAEPHEPQALRKRLQGLDPRPSAWQVAGLRAGDAQTTCQYAKIGAGAAGGLATALAASAGG